MKTRQLGQREAKTGGNAAEERRGQQGSWTLVKPTAQDGQRWVGAVSTIQV
jgi:hypothetical protein